MILSATPKIKEQISKSNLNTKQERLAHTITLILEEIIQDNLSNSSKQSTLIS